MNRTLELWKQVPGACEEVFAPSQTKSSPSGKFLACIANILNLVFY